MTADCASATVADLQREGVLLVEDGNHGEYRPRPDEFLESGVAFIRAADMDDGRVLFESADHINETARARITKGIGAPGDVLLSHKGTVGKVALVPDSAPAFVCSPQTTFWRTCDQQRLDRRYLHAFLRSPGFHAQLATRAGETDMAPYVSLTSQRGLRVALPPIEVQRAIGNIVSALDDKLGLNRRINNTLEAMARALFKSWFVDFDPVRAKSESRHPGLPQSIADLFPDGLEEYGVMEIPAGWRSTTLADLAILNPEVWTTTSRPDSLDYIDLSTTKWGRIEAITTHHSATAPSRAQRVLRLGDTLVGTVRPGNGSYALVNEEGLTGSTAFAVLRPRRPEFTELVYLAATERQNIEELAHLADGAAYPAVRPGVVLATQVVRSPDAVVARFSELTRPILQRIAAGDAQSRTLAETRDALLPRLISGEIRLPQAERLTEAAPI